jgi:hypothetical protein
MKKAFILALIFLLQTGFLFAGLAGSAVRETAEFIFSKFGRGAAGETIEELAENAGKAIARYGDEALPLIRKTGHAGFTALKEAGEKAPQVLQFCAKKGDDALWLVTQPKKLSFLVKYGDEAGEALLKHPGIADNLIAKYGDDAAFALTKVSRGNAQRLNMLADEGLFSATSKSQDLLKIVREYGDEAMDFIWQNKGALATVAVLGSFVNDPKPYLSGAKDLTVGVVASNPIWAIWVIGILTVFLLPYIVSSLLKTRANLKQKGEK